jgi:peroxiredoxin
VDFYLHPDKEKNMVDASVPRPKIWPVLIGGVLSVILVIAGTAFFLDRLSPPPSTTTDPSMPLATINGVAITRQMLDTELKISRLNVMEALPSLSGEDLTRAQKEGLNQLVNRQLVLQAAARDGFRLTDAAIQERAKLLFGAYGEEALDQALTQAGATRHDLLCWVSEITTVEEYTVQVIMDQTTAETRQRVYNDWLNAQQAQADIKIFLEGQTTIPSALPGQPAPNFSLTTTTGDTVSLTDYRGQPVLINFWASWCPSCTAELPEYETVYQQQSQAGHKFAVLAVNLQESTETVTAFAQGLGLTYPVLIDREGQVTIKDYQIVGMPGSILVDAQGLIVYRHVGPLSGDLLAEKLAELN